MSDTHTLVSRRQFCTGGCQVASCAALAALASACGGSPSSPSSPGGGSSVTALGTVQGQFSGSSVQVTTAGSALTDVGGAVLVESIAGLFLLARTGTNAFAAIDAVCTHEAQTITTTAGDIYVCQGHGSRFTRTGQVVGGPAQASLRQYATSFANGTVTIAI